MYLLILIMRFKGKFYVEVKGCFYEEFGVLGYLKGDLVVF